ncbi:MAG: FliM/FliN family flagellar motor switch protein [Phycisphaerae bacterium]|jgi:flagellar motor switch protein FliN/FliY
MLVEPAEIDALRSEGEAAGQHAAPAARISEKVRPHAAGAARETKSPGSRPSPNVARLLKIRVPVIALLASRPMLVSGIRRFTVGTIIEFEKSVGEPIELLVNNRRIGRGEAIKAGEKFGLHITQIDDAAARIRSLGPRG